MDAPKSLGTAIQDILTRGLDAAATYYTARLQVNDPTPSVAGANGTRVAAGQSATTAAGSAGVPQWVWYAGLGLLAVAVVVPILRRG